MDLLKRQEIVIEKSTELKQLVGIALSLDECEEFVSDVLKASDKAGNCILGDVMPMLHKIAECFNDYLEDLDPKDDTEEFSESVELMKNIVEDNGMFIRN